MSVEEEEISSRTFLIDWELISTRNPVFRTYATHASLLLLKVLALGFYTLVLRLKRQVFSNLEDLPFGRLLIPNDPAIERVRRAHRNDLENILPYLIVGFLFVLSEPIPKIAMDCYRLVTFTRCLHTVVYVLYPVGKLRTISCLVTLVITAFMAIDCIAHF